MNVRRTAASLATVATLGVGGVALAAPASAAPVFTGGLVNITIFDVANHNNVNLQVPVGVAANVCGVTVAALAQNVANGLTTTCNGATTQNLPVAFRP